MTGPRLGRALRRAEGRSERGSFGGSLRMEFRSKV